MAVELCVAQEGIWFDQNKYEEAEARYQEIVADRHAGLRVEVELGRDVFLTFWFSVSDCVDAPLAGEGYPAGDQR